MMKKLSAMLTAAIMCVALAVPASAQSVAVGGEVGLDFASFGGDVEDSQNRTGLSVNGVLRAGFPGPFGLQTGLGFTSRGSADAATDSEFHLSYMEIPALLTWTPPSAGVSPRLYAGPTLAFQTGCSLHGSTGEGSEASIDCDELQFETKSLDLGLAFGGGITVSAFGPGLLSLDGRYNLGLSDINDVADSPSTLKNRAINVRVGYLFPIGG